MRGGCKMPEITPFEPDLDNSSVGNDTFITYKTTKGRFLVNGFFFGEIPATATFSQRQELHHEKPIFQSGPKPYCCEGKKAAYS